MRRLLCFAWIFFSGVPAIGQLVGPGTLKIVNSSPISPQIAYGQSITYSLTGAPSCGVVTGVGWTYQYTGPGCTSGWSPITSGVGGVTYGEITPGTFTVKANCGVQCGGFIGATVTVTTQVTVLPPDAITLPAAPANTATLNLGMSTQFKFQVKSAGYDCPMLVGTPREDVTQRFFMGGTPLAQVLPSQYDAGDPNLLFLMGPFITDTKSINLGGPALTIYYQKPAGWVFYSMKQKLYIKMNDPCGGAPKKYPLSPSFNVTYSKVDNFRYKVTVGP